MRTRGYILNTILNERAIEDRLRGYSSWIAARNLSNEIPDEAAQSLVDAIVARYDIPQRFYALKARLLGLPKLADYDRFAPLQESRRHDRLGRGSRARTGRVQRLRSAGRRRSSATSSSATGSMPLLRPGQDARRLLRHARSRTCTRTC